jgi:hypothetical protein
MQNVRAIEPAASGPETLLFQLEQRYSELCDELAAVETRLRQLRTAADLCPTCGGSGQRITRGGLYGELQRRKCPCQER